MLFSQWYRGSQGMVRVEMIGGLSAIALFGSLFWPLAAFAQISCMVVSQDVV